MMSDTIQLPPQFRATVGVLEPAARTTAMKLPRIALVFGLILAALVVLTAQTAAMAEGAQARTITMTGTGTVYATPDKAIVTIGVETRSETAGAALADNNAAMQAVMDALKAGGIAETDLQTSTFSISPLTARSSNSNSQPARLVGYLVSNQVRATIRKLDTTGALLDRVVRVGSNRIDNINFSISKPEPHYDEARRLAVQDAIRKAKLFTQEAGVNLGKIITISQDRASAPVAYRREAALAAAPSVPIAAGQQSLTQQVVITWQLAD